MWKPSTNHSSRSSKRADFSVLQTTETRCLSRLQSVQKALERVDWFVELAPVISPSPKVPSKAKRVRILFDHQRVVWPFEAAPDALPLDAGSIPAILIRHAWQPGPMRLDLHQWVQALKPGGSLIAVSANPWHLQTWRWLGMETFRLPSWPHFIWANTHPELKLELNPFLNFKAKQVRLSPLLVVVAQKRSPVAPIALDSRSKFRPQKASAQMAQCRAA